MPAVRQVTLIWRAREMLPVTRRLGANVRRICSRRTYLAPNALPNAPANGSHDSLSSNRSATRRRTTLFVSRNNSRSHAVCARDVAMVQRLQITKRTYPKLRQPNSVVRVAVPHKTLMLGPSGGCAQNANACAAINSGARLRNETRSHRCRRFASAFKRQISPNKRRRRRKCAPPCKWRGDDAHDFIAHRQRDE